MDQDLNALCDRWLAAWSGNRPDALIEYYTEDAWYADPGVPDGLQGRSALLGYLMKLLKRYPDWTWRRAGLYPTPQGFVLKWQATVPRGSKIIHCTGMDLVELRDGKISRNEVYFNAAALQG